MGFVGGLEVIFSVAFGCNCDVCEKNINSGSILPFEKREGGRIYYVFDTSRVP